MDTILVFDFGSQTTQLIARRIREKGVYTDIVAGDSPAAEVLTPEVKGIIFSGSPYSVYQSEAPAPDPALYESGIPILGICYGFHHITHYWKGDVFAGPRKEFGRASVSVHKHNLLFNNVPGTFTAWMSHGDSVVELGEQFELLAQSEHHIAAAYHPEKHLFGIQFHPEVTHCEYGDQILANFAIEICGASCQWDMNTYMKTVVADITAQVGSRNVLLLISGGVDSTVVAAILLNALPPAQVHLLHIDTGLMRKQETEEVMKDLRKLGASNLYTIDASSTFLDALENVTDPEEKRRIIGDLFISVQEDELRKHGIEDALLAQGTLYTDLIESGKGVGQKAAVIKTHHNVRAPLIAKKREKGELIEPLDRLYKDEVRSLGLNLGITRSVVMRHPFPGPGLAVRILGEVTREKCDLLREADHIFIQELKKRGLYEQIWQAFCVLLPVRTVGVAGDVRKYGWVISLRAVNSRDGMTADVFPFPQDQLVEISSLITNSLDEVGRVVYDVSSKPPSTIEWE